MGFDSFIQDFDSERDKVKTTPTLVDETFTMGQKLVDTDWLPKINSIKILKPFTKELKELNLYKHGWRFNFSPSKEYVGLCSVNDSTYGASKVKKNIYVSVKYAKHDANWEQNFKGVILHEVSHALINQLFEGKKSELEKLDDLHAVSGGHGLIFKEVCCAISGAECRIFYEGGKLKESFKKFKYDCSFCGHKGYGDYQGFTDSCSECGKDIITEPTIN